MADANGSRQNQIQSYTCWVNAQLKKKHGKQCINDLVHDMQDGTAFADLIEVIAGETLPGVIYSPSNKSDMLSNINQVINFMTERNIRMHVTYPEDIVHGKVNSIMRLVLALAAHYKPNNVRESHRHTSLASYAQSAAVSLADGRRNVAAIVHRPKKPFPQMSEGTSVFTTHSSSPAMQKSVSQDFMPGCGDIRYRRLSESYANLSRDYEILKSQHQDVLVVHEDACAEMKLMKKAILALQSLLLNSQMSSDDDAGLPSDVVKSLTQFPAQSMTAEEATLLNSRLLHSEETQKDIKQELSKMRHDCIRRQGAEAGLQQIVEDQQKVILHLEAELRKATSANSALESTKLQLEQKLQELEQPAAETNTVQFSASTNHNEVNLANHSSYSKDAAVADDDYMSTKLIYFSGSQSDQPSITVINRRAEEVTLKDVQSVIGQRTKCCYHFQTQRSDYGIARKEISDLNQRVPSHNGTVTVWIEDMLWCPKQTTN